MSEEMESFFDRLSAMSPEELDEYNKTHTDMLSESTLPFINVSYEELIHKYKLVDITGFVVNKDVTCNTYHDFMQRRNMGKD